MNHVTNRRGGAIRAAIIGLSVGSLTLTGCGTSSAFTAAAPSNSTTTSTSASTSAESAVGKPTGMMPLRTPERQATTRGAPAQATASSWRMVDLGAGDGSVAMAVNDRGHVVGTRAGGNAFMWRHGRLTNLGAFTPTDVNNRDEVVGYRVEDTHAVLWRAGVLTDLGTPDTTSVALAVNDRTEVVGWSSPGAEGRMRAFSWRNGVLTLIGAEDTAATDVNNRGQIVGNSGALNQVAVRWWRGKVTQLSTEPTQAVAVNRFGTVAGVHFGARTGGFVWRDGRFIELPPPAGEFGFRQPEGVNDRTQVVGSSSNGAFVWDRGRTTLLPGGTHAIAYDISERGVIAGSRPTTSDGLAPRAVIWHR